MQSNILTITLNPAVDFATTAPKVYPDHKLRCTDPTIDPGGGGINVARAIQLLGGQATALIAIGGAPGAQLLQLLALEGVPTVAFQGPGDTRLSFSVTDDSSGHQYRFVMPGAPWKKQDVTRGLNSIDQAVAENTFVVLSGSQPPGVAKEFPSILAGHIKGRGAQIIVDTSGPALFQLAREPHETVFALRMNGAEAEELAGRALPTAGETATFARSLVDRGVARNVVVARGTDGSVLSNGERSWHARGPEVTVVSRVGAGDSFVGAFALWLARGEPVELCLKAGVVAASAACTSPGTGLCERKTVERMMPDCMLTDL